MISAGKIAEYAGIMAGAPVAAMAYVWMAMEGIYDLAAAARLAWRIARGVFLAVGWAAAVGRMVL